MHKTNLFVDKCAELLAFRAEFIAQSDFNCVTYQKIMFYNILLLVQFFKLKTISKLKLLKICEQIYCESPEVYKGLLLSFLIKDGSKEDLYTAQLEINKLMGGFYEKCTSANKLLWLYEQWYKALLNLYSHKDVSTKTEFLSEIATTLSFLKNRLSTEVRNPELLNKLEKTVAEYVTKFLQGSFNITDFEQATETLVENSLLKEHVTAYQNVLKEPNADFLTTDIITSEINTVTEDHIPILSYFVGYFFGVFEHTKLNSELLSFGDKCSMAGILPNIDTSVNSLDIDSDIKDLSELPVLIKTRKAQTTWSGILTDLQLCEKSLDYDQAILVDYFLLLRAAKKQPDLISGTINIETVARFFNSFQSVLTNNYEFSTQNTWLVGALFSSFPTNQDVITEFRIAAWNWYKTAAELQNKGDVINYTGFERQIINLLHDAPSPYHVSIIKCYYDYLIYDDELSFETLKTTLDTLHIVINKDYKATFGAALESVIKTTSVLLKKIKAIYEDNNDYNLQSLISTGTIDANFRKRLLVLLSKLTGNSVSDLSALSYAELNRLYIFSFEEMPEKIREDIIIALKNLRTYIKRSHNVSINKFSTTLCVNNIIKTYTYRLLFFYSEHTEKLIPSTLKNLLALSEEVFFDKFVPQLVFCRNKLDVSKRDYDYYVLVQIYNLIDMCIEMYTSILGRHLDLMENIDNVVKDDLVADYLRSTVLYPLNIILAELLESMKAEDFNRNVICVGDAVGTLLYVKDTKNLTTDVSTKIVVTEDLNPHSILPRCVGLITKNKQPPLSHMSVLANQRKIPWFSPDPKEFDRIKSLALTDTLTNYYLYVSLTSCFLENVIKPAVTKTDQKMIVVPMLPVGVTSTYIVPQNTFDYSTVGSKAYNLSKVREYFPLNSLDSYCITYNAFQEFIKPIFAKYISQGNGPIEDTLQAIRIDIKSVNFGDQFMAEFNNLINGRFANKQVILRSTTNVEDLNDHTGAGIYESVIVEDKKQLVTYLREVYSSFYTLKAWEDRRFEQFNEDLACMAVLIQELIQPVYSFVLHTHSPLNSDASVGLIELVPGLGESLVSGRRVFSGYSHQFSFNYRTGELKKQHTLSKNFIAGINKVIATAEVKDTLSGNSSVTTEIRACISNIFTDSQKLIEVFNNHQDVEGLILLDKSTYKYIIVQSRNQPKVTDMSSVNPRDKKKTNKNVSSEAHIDPISHINPVDKDAYTVSSFKNKKINLIDLYIETCGKVYGKDNSIVMPYGSSYNMAQNKTILWEYVKDLDVNVFLLNKTCPYETKQLDTAHVEKFNGYFQKLALKNGLKVTNHEMITAISRAITMAEKANFNAFNYFSHTPVLTTAVLEKLTFSTIAEAHSQELLLTRVTEYISNYRLSNDASVYYIRKFVDESDFGLKLIILFIYAHLTGTKLYCCLEYAWSDFSKNLYEVFKELKLISNAITYEAFLIDVFLNLTVEDILCPLENVHVHYLKHKNNIALGKDLFSKYILKHSDIRNTIFLTDHLDVSTIMETLVYLNHNKVTCDFKLALDKIKVPYTSKDFTCARLNGELKKAQIFYFLIKRYIKDIKHNKISELEAANYFRENNVILKLNATLKELFEDKHSIGDFANKSIKVLQNSENILTAIKEQGDLSKYYSYFKNICIVDITDLPDDTQLIFSSAPRKAAVYILYRPVKNKNNKIVGYDYINVGKDPDSEVSIFGLRDLLTVIEMLFKTESKVCNYQNVWVSHGMYASMVRGPSSSTCENCSIITPLNLAELLYKYVLFTRKNSSIANIERFDSFYDKLLEFLYSDVMISILKKIALNTLKLGFDNIELIRSFDTFHLSFLGMGGKEQTVEIEFKNTNVLPFTWYFSTGYAKKLKRDLWDWTPKGYFYWHSYYGTHKAIHYFENFLKRNLGKITKTDIKESINFTFSAKRYNTSEDVFINESIPERIRIVKELIRLSKVLKDEEIANTCLNLIPKITDAKVDPSNIFEKIRAIDIKIEKEKEELVGELQE